MITHLSIQNYALIENLEIDFPAGLVIITGETGAGKSILLGALSLLMGAKFDSAHLKDESRNCVVEGEFTLEGREYIIRRVISSAGRSRCFVNDEPATVQQLGALSAQLIDIHAQNQHLLLSSKEYQMRLLDLYAGLAPQLEKLSAEWAELQQLKASLKAIEDSIAKSASEREYNQFRLAKLREANLRSGEMEELEGEHRMLANAEDIREALSKGVEALNPMGVSFVQGLKESISGLEKYAGDIPQLAELASRLESCRIECKDIESELENVLEKSVADPARLEAVENRTALLEDLMRRFNCSGVEQLIELRTQLESEVGGEEEMQVRRDELLGEVAAVELSLKKMASEITKAREAAAVKLGETISESVRRLEMPYAELKLEISPLQTITANGGDDIKMLFSANRGAGAVEISKAASGGELSRVMLCVKEIMARYTGMPTMIFDEIDTGVSGKVADKMGDLINDMAANMQVIAITHLPQIASKGKAHFQVFKREEGNGTRTNIRLLNYDQRVEEIASMLSGSTKSAAAYENAKFLLKNIHTTDIG